MLTKQSCSQVGPIIRSWTAALNYGAKFLNLKPISIETHEVTSDQCEKNCSKRAKLEMTVENSFVETQVGLNYL